MLEFLRKLIGFFEQNNIPDLLGQFSDGYYCDEDAMRDAVKRRSMFNIIDHKAI